jgi:hypothetical protein
MPLRKPYHQHKQGPALPRKPELRRPQQLGLSQLPTQCPSLQPALNHPTVPLPKNGKWPRLQLSPTLSVTSISFVFSRCFADCAIRNLCRQDWLKTHEGGTEDDFKAYWLGLSVEQIAVRVPAFPFSFSVPLIFVCLRRLGMEICGCFAGTRCSRPIIFCTDYSIPSLEKDSRREKEQERYVSILRRDSLLIHFFSLMFFVGIKTSVSLSRHHAHAHPSAVAPSSTECSFSPRFLDHLTLMEWLTDSCSFGWNSLTDLCSLSRTHARFTDSRLFFAHGLASLMDRCSL